MADVRNCNLPEDVYYLVEKHVWARQVLGVIEIGLTDVAQNLAKTIISVTPKKVGRKLRAEQSVATVESGKWVGPVPCPVAGVLVEVNTELVAHPGLLNTDPYGAGWVARIEPDDWDTDSANLVTGAEAMAAYAEFLEREGISCEE
ncbi:glycine cleavage system protein H [Mycolicibacterium moriokaense]|nr:glycine cleavage system protein H [Mycolicibacterium moriokaense]